MMESNEYKKRVIEATKHFFDSRVGSGNRPERQIKSQAKVKNLTESLLFEQKRSKPADYISVDCIY